MKVKLLVYNKLKIKLSYSTLFSQLLHLLTVLYWVFIYDI